MSMLAYDIGLRLGFEKRAEASKPKSAPGVVDSLKSVLNAAVVGLDPATLMQARAEVEGEGKLAKLVASLAGGTAGAVGGGLLGAGTGHWLSTGQDPLERKRARRKAALIGILGGAGLGGFGANRAASHMVDAETPGLIADRYRFAIERALYQGDRYGRDLR
jgi:hypothetical protein